MSASVIVAMSSECFNAVAELRLSVVEKAVILQLGWFADENGGSIFPTIRTLMIRTSLSERSVQKALRKLEARGFITPQRRSAGGRSTEYRLRLDAIKNALGEQGAPAAPTPRPACTQTPSDAHLHPVQPAPRIVVNTTEQDVTLKTPARTFPSNEGEVELPDWLPAEQWRAFVEMRRKAKVPMTNRATKLLINKLARFRDQGQDVGEILDQSVVHGWRDVYEPSRKESNANKAEQRRRANLAVCQQVKRDLDH